MYDCLHELVCGESTILQDGPCPIDKKTMFPHRAIPYQSEKRRPVPDPPPLCGAFVKPCLTNERENANSLGLISSAAATLAVESQEFPKASKMLCTSGVLHDQHHLALNAQQR